MTSALPHVPQGVLCQRRPNAFLAPGHELLHSTNLRLRLSPLQSDYFYFGEAFPLTSSNSHSCVRFFRRMPKLTEESSVRLKEHPQLRIHPCTERRCLKLTFVFFPPSTLGTDDRAQSESGITGIPEIKGHTDPEKALLGMFKVQCRVLLIRTVFKTEFRTQVSRNTGFSATKFT